MLRVNFVGKPCAGKPHARFDEGDRWIEIETCLYSNGISVLFFSSRLTNIYFLLTDLAVIFVCVRRF